MDPIQYDRITSSLASLRDWPGAFRTAGREHKARAGRARTAISAGEAYLDAAACAHMHAILSAADALGEPAVVLLGSPQYYARFGFRLAGEHGIQPPVAGRQPHFQVRTLTTYQPSLRGAFHYPEPFDRL